MKKIKLNGIEYECEDWELSVNGPRPEYVTRTSGDIWGEYKIVDHSNSTAMGYSNEETEAFKIEYKDAVHWKYEMSRIELNKLGQEGWELVTQDGASQIYLRRPL